MHFYCKKTTSGQKLRSGGCLINPCGAEDVKRTKGWEFSRELNSPTPGQLAPCPYKIGVCYM